MRREVAGGGDQRQPSLVGVAKQQMLADARLDALDRVEVAVLAQQASAERRDQRVGISRGEVGGDELPGLVDVLLAVEQTGKVREQRTLLRLGQPCRRHIQEAVEVHAHRRVEHAAHQLRRGGAPQALLDGVGERERVERGVPVAELVARREAGDASRGGERDR